MSPEASPPWMRCISRSDASRLRLFCFPSAGGGASLFAPWPRALPRAVEVCAVQLPGHEDRPNEPLLRTVDDAVRHLLQRADAFTTAIPFAFFGHSMGALIAFELTRALRRQHLPAPRHLFTSACRAPQHASMDERICRLPDAAFIDRLRAYGGIPDAILAEPDLMRMLTPIFRADFELLEAYQYRAEPPLDVAITALGGTDDAHVTDDALRGWCFHTTARFEMVMFPAGHFFIRSMQEVFLRTLSTALLTLMPPTAVE